MTRMLTTLILASMMQKVILGAGARQPSVAAIPNGKAVPCADVMASGEAEHFAGGIDVVGTLIWPSDMTPSILDVQLEDESGVIIDSTNSGPNNRFHFSAVAIINPLS